MEIETGRSQPRWKGVVNSFLYLHMLKSLALPAAQSRCADGVGEWNRRTKPTIRKTCVVGKTRKKNPMPTACLPTQSTASCSSNRRLATAIVAVRTGKPWAMGP